MMVISFPLAYYSADAEMKLSDFKKQTFEPKVDVSRILEYAQRHQILGVIQNDSHYPAKLMAQVGSPYLFYYQGNLDLLKESCLGIVGPRRPSEYAQQIMQMFCAVAGNYRLVTVSGFARGIDQLAHRCSLKEGIPTIAVLGGGFQHYLRGADRELLAEIVRSGGLVISQFKIGFEPTKWSFPQRNKLLAQIVDMLFLPEAEQKSGSLITTEFVYQMGKMVYSVPAPLFNSSSAGVFEMMNQGKLTLITDFERFFDEKFVKSEVDLVKSQVSFDYFSCNQKRILELLQRRSEVGIDDLALELGVSAAQLMQELTFLEIEDVIIQLRPGIYRLQ